MATRMSTTMGCPRCKGLLTIMRSCGRVRMACDQCDRRFQIHEVADRLDEQAEEILSRWNCIIYD
ncbi:dual CXXC motif small (seleno)protein [Desulfurivibrio sp. C05AmB]|uniref:dual CXXC motif small (seleno)protein n=1 Tax=Desulfurivibrio sp. C05AmB TaxID=3374371 RepID=UPI00376EE454